MPSIIIGVDSKERITQWNTKAETTTGVNRTNATGKKLSYIITHIPELPENIHNALNRNKTIIISNKVHMVEKTTHYEDITIYPLIESSEGGAVIRINDVTEKVKLKNTMVKTEKMSSVGGLAAGMAHEINNPLAAITQGIQNIIRRLDPTISKNIEAAEKFLLITDFGEPTN